ncbi:MORN repeat-containing protein 1 isoform X5 [Calonectris borealis]|uniref:MORN repeat-containing protein 1 isoform X5 n=1 Tax=Calonectris borealis TaxID=1323832 RepID=UPI003F4B54B0
MKRTTAEQILILQPLEDPTSAVNSRRLEIWAGIRNHQIPSHSATNLFKLIEETERKTVNSCKGGKKPSGRISAEKAEKMTVSQEKMEDSRSHMTSKEYKLQKDQHLRKNSKTLQANILEPGCENTDDLRPAKFLVIAAMNVAPDFSGDTLIYTS